MDNISEMIIGGLTAAGSFGIASAILAWMINKLTATWLSKSLDQHKANLEKENAVALEELKSELTKQQIEHEVQYKRIDEKVGDSLAELYVLFYDFYESVSSYVAILESDQSASKEDKLLSVAKADIAFGRRFQRQRIYIPPALYAQMADVRNSLRAIAQDFRMHYDREKEGRRPLKGEEEKDWWMEAHKKIQNEAKPTFDAVVSEIQRRLGVKDLPGVEDLPGREPVTE